MDTKKDPYLEPSIKRACADKDCDTVLTPNGAEKLAIDDIVAYEGDLECSTAEAVKMAEYALHVEQWSYLKSDMAIRNKQIDRFVGAVEDIAKALRQLVTRP